MLAAQCVTERGPGECPFVVLIREKLSNIYTHKHTHTHSAQPGRAPKYCKPIRRQELHVPHALQARSSSSLLWAWMDVL